MPRANRYFLPSYVWHITQRCHQRKFFLKFARGRRRYLYWVFEAKQRTVFPFSILGLRPTPSTYWSIWVRMADRITGPNWQAMQAEVPTLRTIHKTLDALQERC